MRRHLRQYKAFPVPSQGNLPYSDPEHNTSGLQAVSHTEYSSNLPARPLGSRNDWTRHCLLLHLQEQQSQHSGTDYGFSPEVTPEPSRHSSLPTAAIVKLPAFDIPHILPAFLQKLARCSIR